jgi:hypothetical protein
VKRLAVYRQPFAALRRQRPGYDKCFLSPVFWLWHYPGFMPVLNRHKQAFRRKANARKLCFPFIVEII